MAVRDVRLWPDPVLTQTCAPVDPADDSLTSLIEDLFDTMYAAKGRGLAAPQIGVLKRVFVVDVSWKEGTFDPRVFLNPVISSGGEAVVMDEQCLSIPNLPMSVSRPASIAVKWMTRDGSEQEMTYSDALARCIQHEMDHLNGIVIFDHQPPDARAELEARYAP